MKILNKGIKTTKFCLQFIQLKFKNNKILFLMDILTGLFRESKQILIMIFPAILIQRVLDKSKIDSILFFIGAVCAVITAISIVLEFIQRSLSNYSLRALNYLILSLNQKAMRINMEEAQRNEVYEDYDKAYDSIWKFADTDYIIFSVILSKTISLIITIYIFTSIHWFIAVLVVGSLFLEFIIDIHRNDTLYQKDQELSALAHKKKYVSDIIFDFKTNRELVLNQCKEFFLKKYGDVLEKSLNIEKNKKNIELFFNNISEIIEFFRTCIIYGFAAFQYWKGVLPISNFILFANAAKQMTYAVWQILNGFSELLKSVNYYEDYQKYMKIEESMRKEGKEKVAKDRARIEFRNVSYQYPNQEGYAVKNLSFVIKEGETAAIVGDNGAGKSTVVKLMMRLYKVTEGMIFLNGKSIYEYSYQDYLSQFAPVFQDFMLYSFTIRENLIFDRNMEEKELYSILQSVKLDRKVSSLPKGLETPYTKRFYEDGVEFSGGEEQKLALTRALAKKGMVLILDEPTAALDPLAEYEIYELIRSIQKEKTKIFVSHRLGTTRFSDKILVLEKGRLIEEGSHDNLLKRNGLYQQMFSMQASFYKKEIKE